MLLEFIEWDDDNLEHATKRLSAGEIEQALWNADRMIRHRVHHDRVLIRSRTDGGRAVVVIAAIRGDGLRPITAWEDQ